MKWKKVVYEGEKLTGFYGVGRWDYASNGKVCYIYGLHWVVQLVWWIRWKTQWKEFAKWERELLRARHAGFEDGYSKGKSFGFKQGLKEGAIRGREELLRDLSEEAGFRT